MDRQTIKIRGSRLYCNSRQYGQVIDSNFVTNPLLSDYLPQSLNTSPGHSPQPLNTSFVTACEPNTPPATKADHTVASVNITDTVSEDLSSK